MDYFSQQSLAQRERCAVVSAIFAWLDLSTSFCSLRLTVIMKSHETYVNILNF